MFKPGIYYGGGWPKGVRRNPGGAEAQAIILRCREDSWSWRDLAYLLGVDQRDVRYWASGKKHPKPATMRRIKRKLAIMYE